MYVRVNVLHTTQYYGKSLTMLNYSLINQENDSPYFVNEMAEFNFIIWKKK